MSHESMTILLAEDDDGHAQLIERNLKRAGFVNRVVRARDGQETLDIVRTGREGLPPSSQFLLLLDINMPRIDGVEVLRQLKADPRTARIPVIMLTTTDDPREVERCYQYGCSVYITKPVRYEDFVEALTRLGMFLEIVKLPSAPNGDRPTP
ncbi:MAG: response regulator [Planctomycetia bacterium]|nr:response regulator [Planctomycetia bacterium]